jgi:AraC family transcriptional regulator, transcriptional activator of pobA
MMSERPETATRPIRRIEFARHKYGPELLVDVDWIRSLRGFVLTDEPHRLAFHDILLVTAGEGELWLDDDRIAVEPGTIIFTSPGQVRRWQARAVEGLCLFFAGEFLEAWFADPLFLNRLAFFGAAQPAPALRIDPDEARRLTERLEDMRSEIRHIRNDSADLLRAQLYEILVRLNRLYTRSHRGDPDTRGNPLIFRFRRLVDEQIRRQHRLSWYARMLHVTPGHLNVLAHQRLGCPAGRYLRTRLVVEAKRLLISGNLTMAQVARTLGFRDPSYFNRFFRREVGETPDRFRRTR